MKNNKLLTPQKLFFNQSDLVKTLHVKGESFGGVWHFHNEYELVFITKSTGTVLIGDYIETYSENELYLIGSNLPHTWITDKTIANNNPEAFVLQFKSQLFSEELVNSPEFISLRQILEKSKLGLRFSNKTAKTIFPLFKQLLNSKGINKLILIMKILEACSSEQDYLVLADESLNFTPIKQFDKKLEKVFSFIEINHKNKIKLDEIANLANMQTNAFCRYFKRKTNSSVFSYINKIRIGHACKLLLEDDSTIQEICHVTGFNSMSNFINQFRSITNKTPKEYRKYYQDKLNQ